MKYKLIFISFVVVFLLAGIVNGQETQTPTDTTQKEFKEVGKVLIDGKEVMLKAEKDATIAKDELTYTISTDLEKGVSILLGDKEIKIPSYSELTIIHQQFTPTDVIYIELTSKSSGELTLLKGKENMKIFMPKDMGSFYTQKEDLNLIVKDGVLSLKQNQEIIYKPKGAKFFDFMISPENEISLSEKGFTGTFQISEKEAGAKSGKITGDNVGLYMGEPDDKFDKTQNAIFYNYAKKKVFGDVSYQDYVYDFSINTNKADVEIDLGNINFKQGNGKVSRTIKIGEKNLELNFNIKNGEVLIPTIIGLDKAIEKSEVQKAKHDLFISFNDEGIHLDETGEISNIAGSVKSYIKSEVDLVELVEGFNEEQLKYYNRYLLLGTNNAKAIDMAFSKIEPKKGIEFLNAGFSNPGAIEYFIKEGVSLEKAKSYFDIGVRQIEIPTLLENKIELSRVEELARLGIRYDFSSLTNANMPDDALLMYNNFLKKITSENEKIPPIIAQKGDVYASLFQYGVSEEELKEYSEVFLKLSGSLDYSGDDEIALLIKTVPVDIIKDYIANNVYDSYSILKLFNNGVAPKDSKGFGWGFGFFPYFGVTSKDMEDYQEVIKKFDINAEKIARFKALGIPPNKVSESFTEDGKLKSEFIDEMNKEIDKKMKSLDLKEKERYSLPFLDMAYKNRIADKVEKPLAVVILNRNDWNGGFSNTPNELTSLFNTHHLLVYEASTDNEAENALKQVKEKFGKADLVILGGHGATNLINLGKQPDSSYEERTRYSSYEERYSWKEEYSIDKTDESFFKALADVSKGKETDVVLLSCLTGRGDNPIGKIISNNSGVKVFAPKKETNLNKLVIDKNRKLIDVRYQGGFDVTRRFTPSAQ